MGKVTILGDFVGLTLVWYQPVFWMVFYHYKKHKLNQVLKWQTLALILGTVLELIPITNYYINIYFPSHRLLFMYSALGTVYTAYYMKYRGWNYPQAISISFLAIFVGSFYWEVPYNIRNMFITGFEYDWLLHLLFIFPIWYLNITVGWRKISNTRKIILVITGLLISLLFMLNYPVAPNTEAAAVWDSPYYLINRIICTTMFFYLINDRIEEAKT